MTQRPTQPPKTSAGQGPNDVDKNREKSHQLAWTAAILSFFLIQAVIWSFAVTLTAGDRSHAVVHQYDAQALTWDQRKAERESSARLGWTCDIQIGHDSDIYQRRELEVRLTDSEGKPLNSAKITLSAFHLGKAADVQNIALKEVGSGTYQGSLCVEQLGQWQLTGQADSGSQRHLIHQRLLLSHEGESQ